MSIFHDSALIGSGGGAVAYQINQSLRFNSSDSTYLNRTPGSTSGETQWTCSLWVKFAQSQNTQYLFWAQSGSNYTTCEIGSGQINFTQVNGGSVVSRKVTSQLFRDFSAWYHLVIVWDSANATASERMRLYVNGSRITAFATDSNPPQNHQSSWNQSGYSHTIGKISSGSTYFDGYIAEFNHVSGQALTEASFGETDTITGAWIPKKYSGSYGTNGFYLKFQSSGIGTDSSGNGNNWTPNGFVTSGFESDCMVDTPTSNHPTINPVGNTAGNVFTQGNLEIADTSGGGNWQGCQATIPFPTTGKWYYEMRMGGGTSNIFFGISSDAGRYASIMHDHADTFAIRQSDCDPRPSGATTTGTKSGYGYNDIAGIAVNCDTGVIQFYKNGSLNVTFVTTFDPAKIYFASFMSSATGTQTMYFNFGAQGFTYTPPTGFKALNTANLPEPTIKKGGAHFNTVLYTGNGTTKSVSGVGFSPEFVWIKNRTAARNHQLFDIIRGTGKTLYSNLTDAESTNQSGGYLTSFDSDGFTVTGGVGDVNAADPYVSWNWNGGGAGSSNTAGTITSTVSANATAGFSIVTYTGAGSNGTVGHGLGVAPKCVIVKNRSSSTAYNWYVWHSGLTSASYFMNLNRSDNSETFSNDPFGGTAPTSTVFTVGGENRVSSVNYVAYCFSEVSGYSRIGTYVGNSNSDGPYVNCGFKPAWVMVRARSSGSNWTIYDNKRQAAYNPTQTSLNAAGTNVDGNLYNIDLLSNGFKLRTSDSQPNYNGWTYIFIAFAEHPFKYANAR